MTYTLTEADEVALGIPKPSHFGRRITMDEAREVILSYCPAWRNGGETLTVIDNTAEAYRAIVNAEYPE